MKNRFLWRFSVLGAVLAAVLLFVLAGPSREAASVSTSAPALDLSSDSPVSPDAIARADGSLDSEAAQRVAIGLDPKKSKAQKDARTAKLYGLVTAKEDGRPIPGVQVTIFRTVSRYQALTDANGQYEIKDAPAKPFRISFLVPGRVPEIHEDLELRPGESRRYDATLKRGAQLTLLVRSAGRGKTPVANARVEAIRGKIRDFPIMGMTRNLDLGTHRATTDAEGRAAIAGLDESPYQLFVSAEGFVNSIEEIRVDSDRSASISLTEGGTIEGRAVGSDGSPVASGWAFLAPDKKLGPAREYFYREEGVRLREDGSFRISSIPPGMHHLAVVSSTGGLGQDPAPLQIAPGEVVSARVVVPDPSVLTGRVLDAGGRPVPRAKVYLSHKDLRVEEKEFFPYWAEGELNDVIRRSARSDAEGFYRLEGTRAGKEVTLRARADGFRLYESRFFLAPGQTVEHEIRMVSEDATISGWVTDAEGRPVSGLRIEGKVGGKKSDFDEFEARSAEDGHFRLSIPHDSPPLSVYVKVARDAEPWFEIFPEEIPNVLPGAENLSFVVKKAPFIRGEVFSEDGDPVPSFEYSLFDVAKGRFAETFAVHDKEGQFAIPMPPGKDGKLTILAPGFEPAVVTGLDRFLTVILRRGVSLRGRVVDEKGAGLAGALVSVSSLPGEVFPQGSESVPRVATGADGSFLLKNLPRDLRGVLVVCPHREKMPPLARKPFDLSSLPSEGLEVKVAAGAEVEIFLKRANGEPGKGRALVLDQQGWPLDPWIEPSLGSLKSAASPDYYQRGKGLFHAWLEPGSYKLVYRVSRPVEEIKHFPFEVKSGQVNRFSFQVEQ